MTTLFSFDQVTQQFQIWWQTGTRQRSIRQAIARAYATFARQSREWAATYFDEHFLMTHVLPAIRVSRGTVVFPPATAVARTWVEQLPGFDDVARQRLIAEVTPVVVDFLRLVETEIEKQEVVGEVRFRPI